MRLAAFLPAALLAGLACGSSIAASAPANQGAALASDVALKQKGERVLMGAREAAPAQEAVVVETQEHPSAFAARQLRGGKSGKRQRKQRYSHRPRLRQHEREVARRKRAGPISEKQTARDEKNRKRIVGKLQRFNQKRKDRLAGRKERKQGKRDTRRSKRDSRLAGRRERKQRKRKERRSRRRNRRGKTGIRGCDEDDYDCLDMHAMNPRKDMKYKHSKRRLDDGGNLRLFRSFHRL